MTAEQVNVLLHKDIIREELVRGGYILKEDFLIPTEGTIKTIIAKNKDLNLRNIKYKNGLVKGTYYVDNYWLEKGYDIRKYCKNCNLGQLEEIRLGLEHGIDVSIYANPKYSFTKMAELRKGLEHGLDITKYLDVQFTTAQMLEIRVGLEDGLDVSLYNALNYSSLYMKVIRLGLKQGLDLRTVVGQGYTSNEYQQIIKSLQRGSFKVLDRGFSL